MLTFLFWNVNRKPLQNLIAALVEEHRVDVLILAETEIPDVGMLRALNPGGDPEFHLPPSFCPSIKIFTRFPREFLEQVSEGNRYSIRRLVLPGRQEVLLAAVHLPSKLRWSEDSQMLECTQLAATIIEVEAGAGHSRTVLVGDMNMNPFEKGIVAAAGFHGVMTRETASRGERIVQDRRYPSSTTRCGAGWVMHRKGRLEATIMMHRSTLTTTGMCSTRSWSAPRLWVCSTILD